MIAALMTGGPKERGVAVVQGRGGEGQQGTGAHDRERRTGQAKAEVSNAE